VSLKNIAKREGTNLMKEILKALLAKNNEMESERSL